MRMSSWRTRAERLMRWLVEDPAVIWLLTIAYILFGLLFVHSDYTLNDEGLLTHYWASWLRRDFLPVFFFQRVHPVLVVLYAPFSAAGAHATLVAHVLVGAAAIPLMAAIARALGQRLPNLPALTVALSPLYFYGGAAGFPNVDGIVGMVLALYLLCVRHWAFAAGLVVGMLPWTRFELAVFCAVMAVYVLVMRRDRSLVLGMAVFPLLYAATGALYHHDALWLTHFPPATPIDPTNPIYGNQLIGLRYFLEPAAAVTPAAGIAAALSLERLRPVERALLVYAVLSVMAIHGLPILGIGNFGAAPRYSMHVLPAFAFFVGRALEPPWEGKRPALASLGIAALVGIWLATRQEDSRAVPILIAAYAVIWAAAWLRAGTVATALTVVLILSGPLLPLRTNVGAPSYLAAIFAWLQARPELGNVPVYTTAHLLAPYLENRLPGTNVYHIAGIDSVKEMEALTNPDGQRARIRRLCAADLYGKTLLPPIAPDDLPSGALLVLRKDVRLPLILPDATWAPRLEVLVEAPDYWIYRLRPAATAGRE